MTNNPLKEATMTNGAVLRCRAVPPYAQASIRMQLPTPPFPMVTVRSATGGEEEHHALPGTSEYAEYRVAQEQWRMEVGYALGDFNLNYGVVDWHLPGEDAEDPWHTMPTEGWKVPAVMQMYGINTDPSPAGWRAQFIQHALITTDRDNEVVDSILTPSQPLTKKEIIAALDPFDLDAVIDPLVILQVAPQV